MVFFTCNNCGASLSKPKVEKHLNYCSKQYGNVSLCCMDCLIDFDEYSYQKHIKCVTELERYSKPGFVPKPSSNKGERKQESWIECVKLAACKPGLNYNTKKILNAISDCSNIPRNKSKFENFLRNSCHNIKLASGAEVFELIEQVYKETTMKSLKDSDALINEELTGATENLQIIEQTDRNNSQKPNVVSDKNSIGMNNDHSVLTKLKRNKEKKKGKINDCSTMSSDISIANVSVNDDKDSTPFVTVEKKKKKKKPQQEQCDQQNVSTDILPVVVDSGVTNNGKLKENGRFKQKPPKHEQRKKAKHVDESFSTSEDFGCVYKQISKKRKRKHSYRLSEDDDVELSMSNSTEHSNKDDYKAVDEQNVGTNFEGKETDHDLSQTHVSNHTYKQISKKKSKNQFSVPTDKDDNNKDESSGKGILKTRNVKGTETGQDQLNTEHTSVDNKTGASYNGTNETDYLTELVAQNVRFKWKNVIIALLTREKEGEMSFKKLCRKTVHLYLQYSPNASQDIAVGLFNKKIRKYNLIKRIGHKVVLK